MTASEQQMSFRFSRRSVPGDDRRDQPEWTSTVEATRLMRAMGWRYAELSGMFRAVWRARCAFAAPGIGHRSTL